LGVGGGRQRVGGAAAALPLYSGSWDGQQSLLASPLPDDKRGGACALQASTRALRCGLRTSPSSSVKLKGLWGRRAPKSRSWSLVTLPYVGRMPLNSPPGWYLLRGGASRWQGSGACGRRGLAGSRAGRAAACRAARPGQLRLVPTTGVREGAARGRAWLPALQLSAGPRAPRRGPMWPLPPRRCPTLPHMAPHAPAWPRAHEGPHPM
jgi:hypothetical protein